MSTLDLSHGNAAGLNTNDPAARVQTFLLDWAELYDKYPTYAGTDLIKIGTLKKGMAILAGGAKIKKTCTTAGVSNVTVQDANAKDIVLAIDPAAAKDTEYMGSQATGDMFDVAAAITFLAADLDIHVNPGATVPKDGELEVSFAVAQVLNV